MFDLPPAAEPPAIHEIVIEAPGPEGPLQGTLSMPAGGESGPIVVIVPGSGAIDRDGNMGPMKAGTYKMLAEDLAARGIGSLRIDKRGMFGSAKAILDPDQVTVADYAADLDSWIQVLGDRNAGSCIYLAGHSEGGLVALAAAPERRDLCGVILLAAPGRPVGAVLRDQLESNPANDPFLDEADAIIERLEKGERVSGDGMSPQLLPLFRRQVQGFLISLFSYDPAALMTRISQPVLIVQGGKDIQIGLEDARRLAEAGQRATLAVFPNANHMLKSVVGDDRAANIAAYSDSSLPIAEGIVDEIAAFIAETESSE
jgi:pimeloyl-ACP methyl ester carboxylesterase